ncbi:hypothetical protein PSHT_00659 [Puccinia striiformis]|uniref:Secreted protein n=1 Tax=Puccinia striiformis TaxID=27350 RepID=A0A2S4WMH8_9BASI|nr:hypothetical protein PSHT_00659 [Puccinia striiformis]
MLQRGTIVLLATLIAALCFVDVSSGAPIHLWRRSTENNPHGLQDKPPSVPFDPKIWAKTHHNPSGVETSQACADEHAGTSLINQIETPSQASISSIRRGRLGENPP